MLEYGADSGDRDKVMIGCVGRQTEIGQNGLGGEIKRWLARLNELSKGV